MINIGIADDHAIVRSGLRAHFSQHVDLRVLGEAGSGRGAMELVRSTPELDVIVIGLSMTGESGSDTVSMIRFTAPDLGILILSSQPEEHYATGLLLDGAGGYLNKDCEPAEIVQAIRTIARGGRYIAAPASEARAEQLEREFTRPVHAQLSNREWEVFIKLAQGEKAGAVAAALSLSVKTVSTYRTRLLQKMNLASNTELTHYALKHELIK